MLTNKWPWPVVEIEWDDAECDPDWVVESEVSDPTPKYVTHIGFLVQKTKKHLVVAGGVSVSEDGVYLFNNRQQIPRSLIKTEVILVPKNVSKSPTEGQ